MAAMAFYKKKPIKVACIEYRLKKNEKVSIKKESGIQ